MTLKIEYTTTDMIARNKVGGTTWGILVVAVSLFFFQPVFASTLAGRPGALPPTCTMVATPSTINKGQISLLSWTSANATSAVVNGVSKAVKGGWNVSPNKTHTYSGTFYGPGGSVTCSATVTVRVAPSSENLVANGDFETVSSNPSIPTNWNSSYWGNLTPTFTYPVSGNGGGKAARITINNYQTGDAKWWFAHVPASSHTLYQYSTQYSSNTKTNVTVEFKMADGSFQYQWLADVAPQSGWGTFTTQITVPKNTVSFTVLHAMVSNGSLTIDNVVVKALPASPFPQGMVTFVFDDALSTQYTHARPILTAAGMKGTYGVITQYVGSSPYIGWPQIATLVTEGNEIASHTRTHVDLTALSTSALQSEVSGSYSDLIAKGITPKTLVYPYGGVNTTVKNATKTAKYVGARGSYFGLNAPISDRYALADIRLDKTTTLQNVKTLIDQVLEDKRWVVFEIHDVVPSGGNDFAISTALFQSIVDYIKQKNVKVVTLAEGANLVQP